MSDALQEIEASRSGWDQMTRAALRAINEWTHWVKSRDGVHIYEMKFKFRDDDVLVMIKGKRGRDWLIAYADGADLREAIVSAGYACNWGDIYWSPDKYPPYRGA